MVLRMPCPTRRQGSDNWYYRRTIPADVRLILASLPREKWPRNWYKTHISISLGTADRTLAKSACPKVAAMVEQQMRALREGPKPLTIKQMSALSGEFYRGLTERDDPSLPAFALRKIAKLNRDAMAGDYGAGLDLLIVNNREDRRRASLEARFGEMTDAFFRTRGINTDEESRFRFIEIFARDFTHAVEQLAKNAEGDFSPDDYVRRFPEFIQEGQATSLKGLRQLAQAWHASAIERNVRIKSADRFKSIFFRFVAWLQYDEAHRVTKADVLRWADDRVKSGIRASTVNKVDLTALKAIFKWGVDRGWLSKNPAEGARIESRGEKKIREPFFTRKEAAQILKTAYLIKSSGREHPKTSAAKRWVPWLCAYSGARVAEMIQIRKQDIRKEQGHWIVRITPDAGGVKNDQFRDVPIHQHLLDTGFIEFVSNSKEGYLFINVGQHDSKSGPIEGVYSRIRMFIRGIIPDRDIQPLHAWRYTFKTFGYEAGIDDAALDAICGHAPKYVGAEYRNVTLKARITAIEKFPRYF